MYIIDIKIFTLQKIINISVSIITMLILTYLRISFPITWQCAGHKDFSPFNATDK